jgi:hypothetical protein
VLTDTYGVTYNERIVFQKLFWSDFVLITGLYILILEMEKIYLEFVTHKNHMYVRIVITYIADVGYRFGFLRSAKHLK